MRVRSCATLAVVVLTVSSWCVAWSAKVECTITEFSVSPEAAYIYADIQCSVQGRCEITVEDGDEELPWTFEEHYAWTFEHGVCMTPPADSTDETCYFTAPGTQQIEVAYSVIVKDNKNNTVGAGAAGAQRDVTIFHLSSSSSGDELWWFDGADPANYDVATVLTAEGASVGDFVWTVEQGTPIVDFENGLDAYIGYDDNSVGMHSTSYSTNTHDVIVAFRWNGTPIFDSWAFTVGTAGHATVPACEEFANPKDYSEGGGYRTVYVMRTVDY